MKKITTKIQIYIDDELTIVHDFEGDMHQVFHQPIPIGEYTFLRGYKFLYEL